MAIGDQGDMQARIRAVLPNGWFPDATPVLDALLAGLGAAWAWVYSLILYAQAQTRIASATDVFLDIIAADFFATKMLRRPGEPDATYRGRIGANLLAPSGTRAALVRRLSLLTGRAPAIFEPTRPDDTGAYATGSLGYGVAGAWGSLALPYQVFVTAYRPQGSGIAAVAGYGPGNGWAGGYGVGPIEYASLAMAAGQVTDAEIQAAVAETMPAASIAWMRISD